jgi:hypothetical protein
MELLNFQIRGARATLHSYTCALASSVEDLVRHWLVLCENPSRITPPKKSPALQSARFVSAVIHQITCPWRVIRPQKPPSNSLRLRVYSRFTRQSMRSAQSATTLPCPLPPPKRLTQYYRSSELSFLSDSPPFTFSVEKHHKAIDDSLSSLRVAKGTAFGIAGETG